MSEVKPNLWFWNGTGVPAMSEVKSNPWFWNGMTRQAFEQELQKSAVLLQPGFGKPKRKEYKNKKNAASAIPTVIVPKFDIEAVRARKNALIKSGVKVAANIVTETVS